MSFTILCDVDGVLADFVAHIRDKCNVQSEVREMDLRLSLTEEELQRVHLMAQEPGFCEDIPWYEGAEEFVQVLLKLGELYVVTAPWDSATWAHERKKWVSKHLNPGRVISCGSSAKALVRGNVLIEDSPSTCHAWLEANPDGFAILRDLPINRPGTQTFDCVGDHPRMLRAESYEEALGMLEGIKLCFA